jgi:hypothetical protein
MEAQIAEAKAGRNYELLVSLLNSSETEDKPQALMAICEILGAKPDYSKFRKAGLIEALKNVLATADKSEQIAKNASKAAVLLCRDDLSAALCGECGVVSGLSRLLVRYRSYHKPEIVSDVCLALAELAFEDSNSIKMRDSGAVQEICSTLASMGRTEAVVADNCCYAIGNIATTSAENQVRLGEIGACEAVVGAFKHEKESAQRSACFAVSSLAKDSPENQTKLGVNGACANVANALNMFGTQSEAVADFACHAIINLAFRHRMNTVKLNSACAALGAAAVAHYSNSDSVAHRATQCMVILAVDSETNREVLGRSGACEMLVPTLAHFLKTNPEAAVNVVRAIGNLALGNEGNTVKLHKACPSVVQFLKEREDDMERVGFASFTIATLAFVF